MDSKIRDEWVPMYAPAPVAGHFAGCPECPHDVEWSAAAPDVANVTERGMHLQVARWGHWGQSSNPNSLHVSLVTPAQEMVYSVWLPRARALEIRDLLLHWWPLAKFPLGGL